MGYTEQKGPERRKKCGFTYSQSLIMSKSRLAADRRTTGRLSPQLTIYPQSVLQSNYIYSTTVLNYNFEVLVPYLNTSVCCYFILLLHYISEGNVVRPLFPSFGYTLHCFHTNNIHTSSRIWIMTWAK